MIVADFRINKGITIILNIKILFVTLHKLYTITIGVLY